MPNTKCLFMHAIKKYCMTAVSDVRRLLDRPFFFGAASGIAIVLMILAVSTISSGSIDMGIEMYLSNGVFTYLVPLSVVVQMGLFKYHRNSTRTIVLPLVEKVGVRGSALPSAALLACCVCCVAPISAMLPAMGFVLAASSFVANYKFAILAIAIMANAIGSVLIYGAILRHKKIKSLNVSSQLVQLK